MEPSQRYGSRKDKPWPKETLSPSSTEPEADNGGLTGDLANALLSAEPEDWSPVSLSNDRAATTEDELGPDSELEFDDDRVPTTIVDGSNNISESGRLRSLSSAGSMYVESQHPLPFKTDVRVQFTHRQGYTLTYAGRVTRVPDEGGMTLRLRIDAETQRHLHDFMDSVREPSGFGTSVTIHAATDSEHNIKLFYAWNRVVTHRDDDAVHQKFIQQCLSTNEMQFALDHYRSLRSETGDNRIDAYLEQVGTILGFCALTSTRRREERSFKIPSIVYFFAAALVCLGVLFFVLKLMR